MAVRANTILEDCQRCIHGLISKLCSTTAPWTSWTAILGYPESDVWELTAAVIYVETPYKIAISRQQGGLGLGTYGVPLGAWDNRKTGGTEEMNIISSRILNLFETPATFNTQFTIVIGGTTYTNTTLYAQGIGISDISGARRIETEDSKEFRNEFTLTFIA